MPREKIVKQGVSCYDLTH